jgi:hypothetical protein
MVGSPSVSEACGLFAPSAILKVNFEQLRNLVHADLVKHEQPKPSLPVWINALAADVSRGFRGICPSSGRFVQWNM